MNRPTETQKAIQEFTDAWEKFVDALYEQLEPIVKKLAEYLESLEGEENG